MPDKEHVLSLPGKLSLRVTPKRLAKDGGDSRPHLWPIWVVYALNLGSISFIARTSGLANLTSPRGGGELCGEKETKANQWVGIGKGKVEKTGERTRLGRGEANKR